MSFTHPLLVTKLNPIYQFNPSPYSGHYQLSTRECLNISEIIVWGGCESEWRCANWTLDNMIIMWEREGPITSGRQDWGCVFLLVILHDSTLPWTIFMWRPFDQWLKSPAGLHSREDPLGADVSHRSNLLYWLDLSFWSFPHFSVLHEF